MNHEIHLSGVDRIRAALAREAAGQHPAFPDLANSWNPNQPRHPAGARIDGVAVGGRFMNEHDARVQAYKASTDPDVVKAADEIEQQGYDDKRDKAKVVSLGPVSPKMSDAIEKATGIKTNGWKLAIGYDHIHHIQIRHGKHGQADHSMADNRDIGRLGYASRNFDKCSRALEKDGTPSWNYQYKASGDTKSPVVQFEKRVDGMMCIQEAVPDSKRKTVFIVTARIQ